MSKVNYYLDSKQKARRRMRRYQTAHKKLSRARKCDRREYSRYCGLGGYYVEREKVIITHRPVKDFGGRMEEEGTEVRPLLIRLISCSSVSQKESSS